MARIILIEDNNDLRELLAAMLADAGHTVWECRDAATGVAQWEDWGADLVVTDLVVPNAEALEKLLSPSRAARATQIIVISGALDSAAPAELATRLAGSRILRKPFRTSELFRLVEDVLAGTTTRSG